jgi:hypothetical protein
VTQIDLYPLFLLNKKRREREEPPSSSSDSEEYEELNLMETDDDSDNDAECWYCSGLYSRDRCGEKWIKSYKWCHAQCLGANDLKTFVCSFCHTV